LRIGIAQRRIDVLHAHAIARRGGTIDRDVDLKAALLAVGRDIDHAGHLLHAIDRLRHPHTGIVGVNLGKNRDTGDDVADYREGIRRASKVADYLVVNVSSPNTPGLRDLQRGTRLEALLTPLLDAREKSSNRVPLLVKIAPDLTSEEREEIAMVALAAGIDGLVVSNTTVDRPVGLVSRNATQSGGLSGRPLFAASTTLLADMYRLTHGRLPLIGVGGVASAADAYQKIRAGACLVQLYTALVFAGPRLVTEIKKGLAELLRAEGYTSVAEAVGTGAPATQSSGFVRRVGTDAP